MQLTAEMLSQGSGDGKNAKGDGNGGDSIHIGDMLFPLGKVTSLT